MPTKTAPTTPAKTPDIEALTHWRDHLAVRMATERLERGQEALEVARAQVTTLAAEVEQARARVHEVSAAVQLGEQPPVALEKAQTALAEVERRLGQARQVAEAFRDALEVLAHRCDEVVTRARHPPGSSFRTLTPAGSWLTSSGSWPGSAGRGRINSTARANSLLYPTDYEVT
jgi:small-conductance mechanosensitive channel